MPSRNPNWTDEELVLALETYARLKGITNSPSAPEIVELSTVLNALALHPQETRHNNFRDPDGVRRRISYFAQLEKGESFPGRKRYREIWDEYQKSPQKLHQRASDIRAKYGVKAEVFFDDTKTKISELRIVSIEDELKKWLAKNPSRVYELTSRSFEILVSSILKNFGFDVELTKQSRDSGVDIYAYVRTQVANFLMLVECKRYAAKRPVGLGYVQRMYGVQQDLGANKSMIVTTSFFSAEAQKIHKRHETQMQLADFDELNRWLVRYK
ncbi:MAG: restriction endonuclease [Thermoanaerobaculia bacterium]|nr:restriction endonuclease [Thermoanaerobaculia bacterium]